MAAWMRDANQPDGLLGVPSARPGIAGTAYDTAWLASIATPEAPQLPCFPTALQWLTEHQLPDGSWGGIVQYEHDRILSTLAALTALARYGRRAADKARIAAGTRYLWQHGHRLASETIEPVGFELLLPALIERAQQAGVAVPPHLDRYGPQRAEKLRLIPATALYSPQVTIVHSLEFLGDQADITGLQAAVGVNGAVGNSPAATAFYYERSQDRRALAYLRECLTWSGGTMAPVLHPCETFELLWAAYHLFLAGVPAQTLLTQEERAALAAAVRSGGVSLAPSFPIPDADDTAVALLLLHASGEVVDPSVLEAFALGRGNGFASFPYERHSSVGVNLHVLHALLRIPGYPNCRKVVDHLLDYLAEQQLDGLYWLDKWHISPYYATAHALCILEDLPPAQGARMAPLLERSREWIRQTQNHDGSWGFYGQPTAEETAYAVLALARSGRDRQRCAAALRYLRGVANPLAPGAEPIFPPLWLDKCLYTPSLVVGAVLMSARIAQQRSRRGTATGSRQSQRHQEKTARERRRIA